MATYDPPSETLPIFDPNVFIKSDTALTSATGDLRYLRFPYAQGAENLQQVDVYGVATFNTTLNAETNIVMGGTPGTNYIEFPDTTKQYTAYTGSTPLVPDPTGTYTTPSSVVVNSYGQITSAVSGTTYSLPSPAPVAQAYTAPSSVSVNSAGQITAITSGTAYALPSPAPTTGDYTAPSSVSVNSAGQITAITAGTAYALPSPAPVAQAYTAPSSVSVNSAGQITAITSGTAYALPSPAPVAGNYTNANISVNSAGQITSASNGTTGSKLAYYNTGLIAGNQAPLTTPLVINVDTGTLTGSGITMLPLVFRMTFSYTNGLPSANQFDAGSVSTFCNTATAIFNYFPFCSQPVVSGTNVNYINNAIGGGQSNTSYYTPTAYGTTYGRPFWCSAIQNEANVGVLFPFTFTGTPFVNGLKQIIFNPPSVGYPAVSSFHWEWTIEVINPSVYSGMITSTGFSVNLNC